MQIGNYKIGKSQYNRPTPARFATTIQVFTIVAPLTVTALPSFHFLKPSTIENITAILLWLIPVFNGIKPFVGLVTDKKTVPIDQVTEMEENKKE